ncbi:MAG: hypothetical protein AAF628_21745 [Planctomycetota bacterium]
MLLTAAPTSGFFNSSVHMVASIRLRIDAATPLCSTRPICDGIAQETPAAGSTPFGDGSWRSNSTSGRVEHPSPLLLPMTQEARADGISLVRYLPSLFPWLLAGLAAYSAWKSADGPSDWIAACWLADFDTGMLRRALPGEVLPSGPVTKKSIGLASSFVLLTLVTAGIGALVWTYRREQRRQVPLARLLAVLTIAPFSFVQLGAEMGRFDQINFMISAIVLGAVLSQRFLWAVPIAAVVMVFTHETALFIHLPMVFAAWIGSPAGLRRSRMSFGCTIFASIAATVVAVAGSPQIAQPELEQFLQHRAADFAVPAGFTDSLCMTARDALGLTADRWDLRTARKMAVLLLLMSPFIAVLAGAWRAAISRRRATIAMPLSALGATPLFLLGFDHFRWVACIFLTQSILLVVYLNTDPEDEEATAMLGRRNLVIACAASFLFLGPIGVTSILENRLELVRW